MIDAELPPPHGKADVEMCGRAGLTAQEAFKLRAQGVFYPADVCHLEQTDNSFSQNLEKKIQNIRLLRIERSTKRFRSH